MRKFYKRLFLVVVVGIILFIYATFIEPRLLVVQSHEFSYTERIDEDNLSIKIAHFTDTQIGEFFSMEQFEKVVEKINDQKPDMIVFTGDLFDLGATESELEEIIALLKEMEAPYGKFSVYGNRDVGGGMYRNYEHLLTEANFQVLKNEEVTVALPNKEELLIYGLDDALLGSPNIEEVNKVLERHKNTIVLLHEPDVAMQLGPTNHALVLAGHSHGGQVYLPFIGALVTTALAEEYVKGWYNLTESPEPNLFVNTGIGNTKLPFRLGNIPQIALVELHL